MRVRSQDRPAQRPCPEHRWRKQTTVGAAEDVVRSDFIVQPVLRPREQVEAQLRAAIISGKLQRGDRLPPEAQLAADFSVSRTTVREALRALAAQGLITKLPGSKGGSFVEHLDHHKLETTFRDHLQSTLEVGAIDYNEVAQFRNLLEVPSARLAATYRTDADLEAISAVVEEEKGATTDDPRVPDLNVRFHVAVATASQNRILTAFVSALHRVAHPLSFIDTTEQVGRDAVRHHIRIHHAIEASDPEAAASAMVDHLNYLREHAARFG
jgi:GntR family transcriptional regulator, transcriptional repressor for pyruvate dehydrogenase complex